MLTRHRKLLQINNYYLLTHLDIEPDFISILEQSKILLPNHLSIINKDKSRLKRVKTFLDILPMRGSKALDVFFEALLQSNQSYIHEKLLMCLNGTVPACAETMDSTDFPVDTRSADKFRRVVMFINNFKFHNAKHDRTGSDNDLRDLCKFFIDTKKYELFKGQPYKDLTADQMLVAINDFGEHMSTMEQGQAVVVLMSHGKNSVISGVDDQMVDIQTILKKLGHNTDHVFKVIVLACCRGETAALSSTWVPKSRGMTCSTTNSTAHDILVDTDTMASVNEMMNEDRCRDYSRDGGQFWPSNSVVLYSTQENYASHRETTGTIFIQSMLSVFSEHHQVKSIRAMTVKIKAKMRELFPDYSQIPDIKEKYFVDFYL